jgi:NAD(P)-dependent dehydrogenase (short-subunit alcohol dehydrogenase family)
LVAGALDFPSAEPREGLCSIFAAATERVLLAAHLELSRARLGHPCPSRGAPTMTVRRTASIAAFAGAALKAADCAPTSGAASFTQGVISMQVDLSGLRALVTGSTQGIGHAIAQKLAASGAEVVLNGRKAEDVRRAAERIRKAAKGCKLAEAPGDVATAAGVAAVIKAAGEIDILVNNVGLFQVKDAFAITDEEWTQVFETNVLSGVRLTRHYAPRMRAKGFGRIIFVSSESGIQIPTEMIHYGFSKAADLALMRGFAQALAASGVTVNAVLPGPTLTEGVERMFEAQGQSAHDKKAEQEFFATARPTSIIKRFTRPEEIADVTAFLVSREAGAISGSPVRADGGVVLSIT